MAKVEDTAELIKNEADIGNAPAIQVHGFPGTKESPSNRGIDNPIFSFENVETGRTVTVKEEADGHSNSNGSVSTVRRGSNISGGISGAHDTLAVPGSQVSLLRRGSQASVTSSGKSAVSVWKRKSLRTTVSIDSISADHTHKQSWKSISRLARSRSAGSTGSLKSLSSVIGEEKSDVVHERIRNLVNAFSERAWRIKERVAQPPTPTESDSGRSTPEVETKKQPQRFDSFIEDALHKKEEPLYVDILGRKLKLPGFLRCKVPKKLAIDPQGTSYLMWLFLLTCAYTYNCWSMFLRASFPYETESNRSYWLMTDYICDLLYLLDIVLVKSHIIFLDEGIFVDDRKAMEKNYVKTTNFKCDVGSLLPLDILYLVVGVKPMLRLPRLLKIQTFWEFYTRFDAVAKAPHAIRVFKTFTYMLFMIHIQTCAFYAFSEYERNQGVVSDWIHKNEGNAYIRCFYFATKTATSIGNNPKPEQINEFMYMTVSWLLGVFVFALLIGQVRDIFQAARMTKTEYRKTMDITINYMQNLKVPPDLQDRVRLWFNYNWEQQKTLNENAALQILPLKMRTDMAINVHFQTLSKVQLFQDCEKGLLRVLVLRLRPVLYLPGDLVCRKGDVGHEMYIVNNGQVQVMGGEKNDIVLATLHSGSVFGEISLLSLAGGNRRTADVKSRGFSNLFVLSKADLQDTIKDYPDAQEALKRKAKKIIAQNAKRERKPSIKEEDVKLKPATRLSSHTPKLVTTVIQALDKNPSTHDKETTQILTGRRSRLQVQSSMDLRSTPEEVLVVETTEDGSKQDTQISLKNSLSPATTERRSRLLKMHSIHESNKKVDEERMSDSALGNTMSSSLDTDDKNKETKEISKDNKGVSSLESGISIEDTTAKTEKKKRVGKNQVAPQEGPLNVWNESKFERMRPVSIVQPMVNGMPVEQQPLAKMTSSACKEIADTSRNEDFAALPGQTEAAANVTADTEQVATPGNLINESIDSDLQPHELGTLRRTSITPSLMSASLDLEDNVPHDTRTLAAEVTVHQESTVASSSSGGVDNLGYLPESDSSDTVKLEPAKS